MHANFILAKNGRCMETLYLHLNLSFSKVTLSREPSFHVKHRPDRKAYVMVNLGVILGEGMIILGNLMDKK